MRYFIFYKNNKPIIAIPLDGGLKIAFTSIGCLPSHTLIRKIFKVYMYIRIFIAYSFSFSSRNIDNVLQEWFDNTEITQELYPVFIWSLVEGRKRYYVHLLDNNANKIYFAKITTREEDYQLLENEKNNLNYFAKANTFYVPNIISFEKNTMYCSLLTSYLDDNYSLYHPENNIFPDNISKEISLNKRMIYIDELLKKYHIEKNSNLNKFIFNIDKKHKVQVSKIHGDFGSENIFKNKNNEFYIIDWERSDGNAPYLTDKVAYWLGKNHKLIKANTNNAYQIFKQDFVEDNKIDVALGLLFLINANFDLAIMIADKWEEI